MRETIIIHRNDILLSETKDGELYGYLNQETYKDNILSPNKIKYTIKSIYSSFEIMTVSNDEYTGIIKNGNIFVTSCRLCLQLLCDNKMFTLPKITLKTKYDSKEISFYTKGSYKNAVNISDNIMLRNIGEFIKIELDEHGIIIEK
jgi:hypothetical protein